MSRHDVVVIGGGHNGLVAACYLARAGLDVLVVEGRPHVGGGLRTEELHPGFRVDRGAHRLGALLPAMVRDLELPQHGLRVASADPAVFAPRPGGGGLPLARRPREAANAIRRFSAPDAANWGAFCERMGTVSAFLRRLHARTLPEVPPAGLADLWSLLGLGGRLRALGRRSMIDVLRTPTMSIAELVNEWFADELLKGTLGGLGVTGLRQGPRAAGTAHNFLHHAGLERGGLLRSADLVMGGMGNLAQALAIAAARSGANVRTGTPVERISVTDGAAAGVVLADGEEIAAGCVVSNADPRRTFLDLLDPADLATEFIQKVRAIRYGGGCAKVHLALDALPRFAGPEADGAALGGVLLFAPSLDYLERAHDDAKYGRMSRAPYLEAVIPSITDPGMAPPGKHVMSVLVQYAPYHLEEGPWDEARRARLGDTVVRTLADYARDFESLVLHREVLTPVDLEEQFGLTEGHIHHGEMTLDQLLVMRPVPGWARYRSPIRGLYLCGAGTHPGGGVSGAPGYNAAREVLRDRQRV